MNLLLPSIAGDQLQHHRRDFLDWPDGASAFVPAPRGVFREFGVDGIVL